MKAIEDTDAEIGRLTRLLEDTRYELGALIEARRLEKLRIIDLALDLARSKEPDHWAIAALISGALDKPAHADDIRLEAEGERHPHDSQVADLLRSLARQGRNGKVPDSGTLEHAEKMAKVITEREARLKAADDVGCCGGACGCKT